MPGEQWKQSKQWLKLVVVMDVRLSSSSLACRWHKAGRQAHGGWPRLAGWLAAWPAFINARCRCQSDQLAAPQWCSTAVGALPGRGGSMAPPPHPPPAMCLQKGDGMRQPARRCRFNEWALVWTQVLCGASRKVQHVVARCSEISRCNCCACTEYRHCNKGIWLSLTLARPLALTPTCAPH